MLRDLDAYLRANHNVVPLAAGPKHFGMTRHALSQYGRRHAWDRPVDAVLVAPGAPRTFPQACLIAVHAAGTHRVLVARQAAAMCWDLIRRVPPTIDLLVPAHWHDNELDDVRLTIDERGAPLRLNVFRSRTLLDSHATELDNVPLTTPARTIVDLAAVMHVDRLRSVLIDGRQRRIVTEDDVRVLYDELRKFPGRPKIRRILSDLDDADSTLEWEFRKEAHRRGFTPYPDHFPFLCSDGIRISIDVAFPNEWVAVETDGFGYHSEREALASDHKRQNRAVLDGWRPFRVDWTRLKRDADGLFAELAALLTTPHAKAGPAPLAP